MKQVHEAIRCSVKMTVAFGAMLLGVAWAGSNSADDAKAITENYGRSTGLCAVISSAGEISPTFVSALAHGDMVVHVLTSNEKARAKLVSALGTSGTSDVIMVERLAALGPLPYYDNFVNLLVVDDAGVVGKKDLSMAEFERVVAPDGVLAVKKGGKWQFTRKPWPAGMDEWTHPGYDATGNRRSKDLVFKPPLGFKWIDGIGIPMSMSATCQGWAIDDGRFFAVNAGEPENLALAREKRPNLPFYLVARDAFNGLLLWKVPLDSTQPRSVLSWRDVKAWHNVTPVAAAKDVVYAVKKGVLAGFDTKSGTQIFASENVFTPWAIRLSGSTVVTTGTSPAPPPPPREPGKPAKPGPKPSAGAVEAFDAATGAKKWSAPILANDIQVSNAVVYALTRGDNGFLDSVFAYDLNSGASLFSVSGRQLNACYVRLLSAGDGYELLNCDSSIVALSARDGRAMWQVNPVQSFWGIVIDKLVWIDGAGYDVMTGKVMKHLPALPIAEHLGSVTNGNDFGCTPYNMVDNMVLAMRQHRIDILDDDKLDYYLFTGARAGCIEGMTPAEGMAFTAPRDCNCTATHPYGFIGIAPVGSDPTPAEMVAMRTVEKGEAFGALDTSGSAPDEWSTFRGNPERSAATPAPLAFHYRQRWSVTVAPQSSHGLVDDSYLSRTLSHVSPPVYGNGTVYVSLAERGEVVALNEKTGAEQWRYRAGSRIETPPTIFRNGCFFGCNDGYVYAVTARDGRTMWRVRIAPREKRMMEHGVVGSLWPVYGSVLIYRNTLYASAGLSSEAHGGTALVALDPATGEQKWARAIDAALQMKNDVVAVKNGMVTWRTIPFDPSTGACDLDSARVSLTWPMVPTGMWDNSVLETHADRKMGAVYRVDDRRGWLLGWNDDYIVSDSTISHRLHDPLRKTEVLGTVSGGRPTALVLGPNAAAIGYGGPAQKQPKLTFFTYDNPTAIEIPLSAGVTHNGIAVVKDGLVLTLDDGSVAMLESTPAEKVASANFVLRVNCGGKAFSDAHGNAWQADQEYRAGSWGAVGGSALDRRDFIGGLDLHVTRGRFAPEVADLYNTERYAMSAYRIAVPNGYYSVSMHFAETFFYGVDAPYPNSDQSAVHRRFNVSLNAVEVLHRFEPLKEAGGAGFTPVVKQFEVEVVNGELTIGFVKYEAGPEINGIEVIGLPAAPASDKAESRPARTLPRG